MTNLNMNVETKVVVTFRVRKGKILVGLLEVLL